MYFDFVQLIKIIYSKCRGHLQIEGRYSNENNSKLNLNQWFNALAIRNFKKGCQKKPCNA